MKLTKNDKVFFAVLLALGVVAYLALSGCRTADTKPDAAERMERYPKGK